MSKQITKVHIGTPLYNISNLDTQISNMINPTFINFDVDILVNDLNFMLYATIKKRTYTQVLQLVAKTTRRKFN